MAEQGQNGTNLQTDEAAKIEWAKQSSVISAVNRLIDTMVMIGIQEHVSFWLSGESVIVLGNGATIHLLGVPKDLVPPMILRIMVMCGMDLAKKMKPQNGSMEFTTNIYRARFEAVTEPITDHFVLKLRLIELSPRL